MERFLKSFSKLKPNERFFDSKYKNKDVSNPRAHGKIKYSDITPKTACIDESNFFYGKNVVVTGEFEKYNRQELLQKLVDKGANIKSSVSSTTNVLLVGKQNLTIVGNDGMSNKEEKAYALIEAGRNIRIMVEDEFEKVFNEQQDLALV